MKRIYSLSLAILALAAVLFSSCERRELEDRNNPGNMALVPIHIDWSQSKVNLADMHSASVWFFPKDGRQPIETPMESNKTDITISLPLGEYAVLIFNEDIATEWDIAFRGTDRYETFEAYVREDVRNLKFPRSSNATPQRHDMPAEQLAAWSLDHFEVTQEMIDITRTRSNARSGSGNFTTAQEQTVDRMLYKLSSVTPKPVVNSVFIKAYVKNLNNAIAATAVVGEFSQGIFLATGKSNNARATHRLAMNNRQYDTPEKRNGTVECTFLTFGKLSDQPGSYTVQLLFQLQNETEHPVDPFNITRIIEENDAYEIRIELGVPMPGQDPGENHPIELPVAEIDPDVGVKPWDDEQVEIK